MATIYDIRNKEVFTTPINRGSKARFTLMQEDSITLKFSTTAPINFALGNWLNYERNGQHIKRYELTDIATPRPNKTTGGYDYELKLDAY